MLSINTNLSSLIAQQSMSSATNKLNQAIERMTTGYKINGAKDNAANYSISQNMQTQLGSYDVAADNVAMGMDLVTTASDIINSMQDKATRLQALCTQARNGTYGAQSMSAINSEAGAIMAEITRLYQTAEYNNVSLFNREAYQIDESLPQAKAEYNGFIEDPKTYTDEEVAAMTPLTDDITSIADGGEYAIYDAEQLAHLAELVNNGQLSYSHNVPNATFVLADDIDLSGINWTPIGIDSDNFFQGTFDGNGHVISGLTIDNSTSDYQGLFGYLHSGHNPDTHTAIIKNVALVDASVKGKDYVGALVGYADSEDFMDMLFTNNYAIGSVSGAYYVGGLVGWVECASIASCYTTGNVSGVSQVGGLVGTLDLNCHDGYEAKITNCASYSTSITGSESVGSLFGGYVGEMVVRYAEPGILTIEDCTAISTLPGIGAYYMYDAEHDDYTLDPTHDLTTYNNAVMLILPKPTVTTLQVGINSDSSCQINFDTNFKFDLSAIEGNIASDEALSAIMEFSNLLSEKSTQLGAVQNRLDSALESITVNMENLTSSLSTIRDADIAEVSSEYIRQQILQQASATLLATANQSPSIALQLI